MEVTLARHQSINKDTFDSLLQCYPDPHQCHHHRGALTDRPMMTSVSPMLALLTTLVSVSGAQKR